MYFYCFRSRSPFRKNFNERSYNDDDFKNRRRDHSPDMRRSGGASGGPKNRVFVRNIPFECRWMEIKDVFREKGDYIFKTQNFFIVKIMYVISVFF